MADWSTHDANQLDRLEQELAAVVRQLGGRPGGGRPGGGGPTPG
jgi:hypothetical protein